MGLFKRSRKAFESFKRFAQDIEVLPAHQPLSEAASGKGLVYEVNPVYLEAGQGGTSSMRGVGAVVFALGWGLSWYAGYAVLSSIVLALDGDPRSLFSVFGTLLGSFAFFVGNLVGIAYFVPTFFNVTDVITRYDRKRQKVWMWSRHGAIEMDWNALTPVIRSGAASAYGTTRLYRGFYVEYGDDGEPKRTHGLPHVVQVGTFTGAEVGTRLLMEYVRRYMEQGPQALPPVGRFLRHRPQWWQMFNFMDVIQDWIDAKQGRSAGLPPPYATAFFSLLFFPVTFLLQVTHWIALWTAPCPTWPRDLIEMHARDLAELEDAGKPRQRRKPVIRVNGQIVESPADDG
ncbi:MAG: DUF6708 domain-containing protein [Anaerolineales bacterium]